MGNLLSQSGSLTNSYSSFSSAVAGLFAFNLICAQFTVPVDAITVLLKTALQFRRNGTVRATVAALLNNAQKTAMFPLFYDRCTIPKTGTFL